jgi:hypothetical protein
VEQTLARARPVLRPVVQRIPREHIQELKQAASLTHLVGQTVKLDRNGKGLCPFHIEKTPSFHVNEKKGTFHCFGCGAHGDAVSWLTEGRGLPFTEAVAYLEGRTGRSLPPTLPGKQAKGPDWLPVHPIPAGVPPLVKASGWTAEVFNPRAAEAGRDRVQRAYRPAHVAAYRDADDRPIGYVLRVEMADGGKFTPQVTWAVPTDAPADADPVTVGRWCLTALPEPRPLYHAEVLAKMPGKPVIVVMGEKKADALQALLGDGAVVVSWAGGDHGRGHVDFSPLAGRRVIIWPDADTSGRAAAVGEADRDGGVRPGAYSLIKEAGAASVRVIVPPDGVEKGWDAGDLIKSGADAAEVRAFIAERTVGHAEAKRVFDGQAAQQPPRPVPRRPRGPAIGR